MKITNFKITNFRSIEGSYVLPLDNLTILIGPNNEGKSNIMYALTYALNEFHYYCQERKIRFFENYNEKIIGDFKHFRTRNKINYEWERDYPLGLRKNKNGKTEFFIEFYFDESEKKEFKKYTKYLIKNQLGIKLKIGEDDLVDIEPYDGEKTIKSLDDSRGFVAIGKIFNKKWNFQYIPAIRTAEMTISIIDNMIERELAALDDDRIYLDLIKKIEELQKPILDEFSKKLTKDMQKYLSNIKKIELLSKNRIRKLARQACQIFIDDGANTLIDLKGDGVKSLLAISVLNNSIKNKDNCDLFIGIEEPESHLHPKAIHRLREVIQELAKDHQLVISTHSPIFVDRLNLQNNIIVHSKKATPVKNIMEIRNSLGVLISDNLQSSEHILLVEGEGDAKCMTSFFKKSKTVSEAISKGMLRIVPIAGASNLSYQLKHYQEMLCNVYAFLDNDSEGRDAYEKASDSNLISIKDIFFANFPGKTDSEFEDLIKTSIYKDIIKQEMGVLLQGKKFQNNKLKWNERVRNVFLDHSKPWNDEVEMEIKNTVCSEVEKLGIDSLLKQGEKPILNLISHLESLLK